MLLAEVGHPAWVSGPTKQRGGMGKAGGRDKMKGETKRVKGWATQGSNVCFVTRASVVES